MTTVLSNPFRGQGLACHDAQGQAVWPASDAGAVAQLLSLAIDYRMDLQQAFDTPRIDASEGALVLADDRLDAATLAALGAEFDLEPVPVQTMPMKFACPSAVLRDGGLNQGATEIVQPWAEAVAASPEG